MNILGKSQTAYGQHKTGSNVIMAKQLKNKGAPDKLINAEEGYRFIRSILG